MCYASEDDLLAAVVPFLLGGLAADEPTIVAFGERNAGLVRAALPGSAGINYLAGAAMYARPAVAIKSYRRLLADYMRQGVGQVRIVGEVPPVALGTTWDWWARYEAAVNHAYDEFPLWSMCAYDTRITPADVLDDVWRTHPRVVLPHGREVASQHYTDPSSFLLQPRAAATDPLQRGVALVDLVDPTPQQARHALLGANAASLARTDLEDLQVAVSEVVTNAVLHGQPPVRLRMWAGPDRIVVTVSDRGAGPSHPYAGLLPLGNGASGGLGLWLAHQLCAHVTFQRDPNGVTVRLTAGNPQPTTATTGP